MPSFEIYTRHSHRQTVVEMTAADLDEVGRRLNRDRFLVGRLRRACGVEMEASVDVLIPAHVVTLVATHQEQ